MTRKTGGRRTVTARPKRAEPPPPLLTTAQAAAQLGVCRDHVYQLTRTGHLGCIDMPGTGGRRNIRIEQAEVDRFIKDHRRKATA